MNASSPFVGTLPRDGEPAVRIVGKLLAAGHTALLAGGCVRDLLLGSPPHDYDIATDATPDRVCEIFRPTRKLGAAFGVVLVREQRRWFEVATFRSDGPYLDGRRPASVTFCDSRNDALRRDFTVNGMFLDPIAKTVIDYVGGRPDLQARRIRAIGDAAARFEEDHLRLLRAVRFAARLEFDIEAATLAAIRAHATKLAIVAAERVREELEKMLVHRNRRTAVALLADAGLLPHLWMGASWTPRQVEAALSLLERLPADSTFESAFAAFGAARDSDEIDRICRLLAFSNDQREATVWLVRHQSALDDARSELLPLATLKRLMANRSFASLRAMAEARFGAMPDGAERSKRLAARLALISPESVRPVPFVTGDDLAQRSVRPGPIYKRILDELYTRQLDERLGSREDALRVMDALLENETSSEEAT